jgi:hypothetical protein
MNNRLKELEELLIGNTLLKVQNQALGNKNPKWKELWQTIQEFIEEQIKENMEFVATLALGLRPRRGLARVRAKTKHGSRISCTHECKRV